MKYFPSALHFLFVVLLFFENSVHADLPLNIEELITDKGKVKLDLSLAYTNSDRQGVAIAEPITIQTGLTSFITLPTIVGESRSNSDIVVGTFGLRYGLTRKAEIYARTSYVHASYRTSDTSGVSQQRDNHFADAWLGINYQFKKEDATAALLGFAEIALAEKHRQQSAHFKSTLFGLTTYTAIDPIVFSFTLAYRLNQPRQDGPLLYKPGNLLLLNPSIAFAVNDRVTLTTGVQWINRYADKVNEIPQAFRQTRTDLLLGVGYGFEKNSTLNFTLKTNVSGRRGPT